MSLINPAILFGLGFAAVPIIIHLMMKAKPKKLLFPALQLILQRKQQNTRRIRLRHWWLLLLRMMVLAILVVAIARPALPAAQYGLSTSETLTLLGIVAGCFGAYFFLMKRWQAQELPHHQLISRRTFLRGGLGFAAFLLFLMFVGWPYKNRVAAEITAPAPEASPDLPVAAVFLFDTSLSMDYRQESKSRLEVAQEVAAEHLESLPSQSRVAIADTSTSDPVLFQADMIGANTQIESLEPKAVGNALNDRLRAAMALQEEDRKRTLNTQSTVAQQLRSDRFVREVYIFTDMSASAWNTSSAKFLRDELKRLEWISVYIIDVGVKEPRNIALTHLELSSETVATEGSVEVSADIESVGFGGKKVTLEFLLKNEEGKLVKHDQREVQLKDEAAPRIPFIAKGLKQRVTQGEIRMVSSDPLTTDNSLKFSIGVMNQVKVAVFGEAPDDSESSMERAGANILVFALQALAEKYDVKFIPAKDLKQQNLFEFDVVCMVSVAKPDEETWSKLEAYTKAGGGLAVVLGSAKFADSSKIGIQAEYYGDEQVTPTAAQILPARPIGGGIRLGGGKGFDLKDTSHPVFTKLGQIGAAAALATMRVQRRWSVEGIAEDSAVILRYTDADNSPALLERPYGNGRVLMMTTAIGPTKNPVWNDFGTSGPNGAFQFIMIDQMIHYLSRRSSTKLNYTAGEEVFLDLDRGVAVDRYLLRKPSGVQLPGELQPDATSIRVSQADELGHFEVVSPNKETPFRTGFSINPPIGESDFQRINELDLDQLLGEGRYAVAESIESLSRKVTTGRLGIEVFPIILAIAVLVFCLELIVSNRFYETDQDSTVAA